MFDAEVPKLPLMTKEEKEEAEKKNQRGFSQKKSRKVHPEYRKNEAFGDYIFL